MQEFWRLWPGQKGTGQTPQKKGDDRGNPKKADRPWQGTCDLVADFGREIGKRIPEIQMKDIVEIIQVLPPQGLVKDEVGRVVAQYLVLDLDTVVVRVPFSGDTQPAFVYREIL